MTSNIPAVLTERKWMQSKKAYRLTFSLPETSGLAGKLTERIDQNCAVQIYHQGSNLLLPINPCYVFDVPHKGKRFSIVLETISEGQNGLGRIFTELAGENVLLSITDVKALMTEPKTKNPRGTIGEMSLRGLHTNLFKNERFQQYMSHVTQTDISTEQTCKAAFKELMQVESCIEINQDAFDKVLESYSKWLTGK